MADSKPYTINPDHPLADWFKKIGYTGGANGSAASVYFEDVVDLCQAIDTLIVASVTPYKAEVDRWREAYRAEQRMTSLLRHELAKMTAVVNDYTKTLQAPKPVTIDFDSMIYPPVITRGP